VVYKKITIGFSAIVAIVIALGISSQRQLSGMANDMDKLYKHPFTVSNAANNINFHLVSMHRYMKDVVLSQNKQQMEWAISRVAEHEKQALTDFDIIFIRFLGEKSQINQTYQNFVDWTPIRNNVIELMRSGKQQEARSITLGKGASHVAQLNIDVKALVEFAHQKAQLFHRSAIDSKERALVLNWIFSIVAVLLVTLFSLFVFRSLKIANKDRTRRNHLIDQHIMVAKLDKEGNVLDISNALCRFLGCVKADLLGKPSHFFDNSVQSTQLSKNIIKVLSTGTQWAGEVQYTNEHNKTFWAYSSILPNFDESYQVADYTNILNDVTNKKLCIVDQLTALPNRRSYDDVLPKELCIAKRHNYPLTLAILDIDFFKKYNDHYGHPQGDIALKDVANKLMASIKRPNDYMFRVGGEEFAFIFSGADVAQSQLYLNQLRLEIEQLHIEHQSSDVSNCLTVSIGAYVLTPSESHNTQSLYVVADRALYLAKKKRNCVVVTSATDW